MGTTLAKEWDGEVRDKESGSEGRRGGGRIGEVVEAEGLGVGIGRDEEIHGMEFQMVC
jgi:hypothetical protein